MKWLTQVFFLTCIFCVFGSRSPRPPSSPSNVNEAQSERSSFPMPGDIVEGDIVLDDNTAALLRGGARNAMANVKKWPKGVVPYILDSSVDDYLRKQIDIGIAEYHKYTCLRFVKRTYEKDYIRVVKPRSGCNSMVGVVGNGEQILNMGPGCEYVGLVLHEFGHAIGYFHEHNRPDRDDVVKVLWDNVQPAFKDAFYKYKFEEADTQGFPYDLTSIMHYENTAFGKPGFCKTTIIVRKDPSYEVRPVYERGVFSPQDIKKINKLYGCTTNDLPPVVLPGDGNPDPNSCKCEDKHAKCPEWKKIGECGNNAGWMSTNCPKSCRVCGEPDSDCKDEFPVACEEWAERYECSNNPIWMNANCPRSCGVCGTAVPPTQDPNLCEDSNSGCAKWASSGECGENFEWMHKNCKKSCRMCGEPPSDCADTYPQACDDWRKRGECEANPIWMGKNCKRSCNKCTTSPGTKPPQTQPPITMIPTTEPTDCTEPPMTQPPPSPPPQSPPPPTPPPNTPPPNTPPPNTPPPNTPPPNTPPPNTPPPPTQPGNCKDVYPKECPKYKSWGWCSSAQHLDYMKEVCSKTCNFCGGSGTLPPQTPRPPTQQPQSPPPPPTQPPPTQPPPTQPPPTQSPPTDCKDVYPQYCPDYKSYGWCTKASHVDYMKEVCSKTCGFCGGSGNCKDVYPQYCPGYKESGTCCSGPNEAYCKEVCKFTCGYCS